MYCRIFYLFEWRVYFFLHPIDCKFLEKCMAELNICIPRRTCQESSDCLPIEKCHSRHGVCIARTTCRKDQNNCPGNEYCQKVSDVNICMSPEPCNRNGRCPSLFQCNLEGYCIPRRRCEKRKECQNNE